MPFWETQESFGYGRALGIVSLEEDWRKVNWEGYLVPCCADYGDDFLLWGGHFGVLACLHTLVGGMKRKCKLIRNSQMSLRRTSGNFEKRVNCSGSGIWEYEIWVDGDNYRSKCI